MVQAYCVKCRSKKEMKDSKAITMKNGKPATQGADFAEIGHRFRCKLATVTVKLAGLSERSDAGINGQFSS